MVAGEEQVWIYPWQRWEGLRTLLLPPRRREQQFWGGFRGDNTKSEVWVPLGEHPPIQAWEKGWRMAHPGGKGQFLSLETQYLDLLHHVAELDQELLCLLGSV